MSLYICMLKICDVVQHWLMSKCDEYLASTIIILLVIKKVLEITNNMSLQGIKFIIGRHVTITFWKVR